MWCVDPRRRQKHLLFKDLFYPPTAPLTFDGTTFRFDATSIAWSPDRSLIAYVYVESPSSSGQIWVMRWDGKEKRLLAQGEACFAPQWSPDGRSIAFVRKGTSHSFGDGSISFGVVDVNGEAVTLPAPKTADAGSTDYASIYNPRWSKDSRRVLLDYSPNAADYIGEGPPLKPKVLSLDTLTYSDLNEGEKNDFVVAKAQSSEEIHQLSEFVLPFGLRVTRTIAGQNKDEAVWSADWTQGHENARGEFVTDFSRDIWFYSPSLRTPQGAYPFRRIARNAELLDWL